MKSLSAALLCMVFAGTLAAPTFTTQPEIGGTMPQFTAAEQTAQTEHQTLPENRGMTQEFPLYISGTELRAERMVIYEGPLLEDGSDTFVVDAVALELYNAGTRDVSFAEITVELEMTALCFLATNIPAGERVLVIEQTGRMFTQDAVQRCYGSVQYSEDNVLAEAALSIRESSMCTLSVTNQTKQPMEEVWLLYKNYYSEGQLYIGGITYIEEISVLEPGQTIQIQPPRYASGYSKIVKAILVQ